MEEDTQELLKLIAEDWITTRGFSFTSSFIEHYKREQKKTLEKFKGTRKKICHVAIIYLRPCSYIGSRKEKENSSVIEVEQDECLDDDMNAVEDED